MIPAEKAKELLDKYWIYLRAGLLYDEEAKEDAKHCALIAVDELFSFTDDFDLDTKEYWQDVKVELEKL
jgi:hypothetical protein